MRRVIVALAVAGLLLVAMAPATLATTTKTPVVGTEYIVAVPDPGAISLVGTTYSLRGMHDHTVIVGTVPATQEGSVNYDIDIVTGEGEMWGATHQVPDGVVDGWYECEWRAHFIPGTEVLGSDWVGKSVCHGFGSLAGFQTRSEVTSAPFGSTFEGYVFKPADK